MIQLRSHLRPRPRPFTSYTDWACSSCGFSITHSFIASGVCDCGEETGPAPEGYEPPDADDIKAEEKEMQSRDNGQYIGPVRNRKTGEIDNTPVPAYYPGDLIIRAVDEGGCLILRSTPELLRKSGPPRRLA